MSAPSGRLRPYGIALRIYLASVAAVIATAIAVTVIVRVAFAPPQDRFAPMEGEARYAAAQLAARWNEPAEVRAEVELLRTEGRFMASVYAADGALVAAGGERPTPLSSAERDALARDGRVEFLAGCTSRRCVAVPVVANGGAVGTLVLDRAEPARPIPRPPPWALPLTLVLLGLGVAAVLLGSGLARPLDRVAQTARALGSGELSARTGLSRRDEVGTVARAIDDMADRVEALVRAQTELIANVAHELRTPLARIRVALDLAEDGDADAARESLAEIAEDLGELERLVNDILASARMELARNEAGTGAPPLRVATLDVRDVVAGAADRFRQRHPERSLLVEADPALPEVKGDAVLLRRAIDNVVDNARKYSAPGTPIRLRAARDGDAVVIQIIDRGRGIAPADLARLFTPFFRADPSRTRATGGVGLGLALSRRIVEAHGGTLVAESTEGVGTTMTARLPAATPGAAARAVR